MILRPSWFADNFHRSWKAVITRGTILLPAGEGKTSFIDARDIAASAASALLYDQHNGHAFDLTGPEALSYDDAARILSAVAGKTIEYVPISDEEFIQMLMGTGVAPDYARMLASLFEPVRAGYTATVNKDVETLKGRAPQSLAHYAIDHTDDLR